MHIKICATDGHEKGVMPVDSWMTWFLAEPLESHGPRGRAKCDMAGIFLVPKPSVHPATHANLAGWLRSVRRMGKVIIVRINGTKNERAQGPS